MPPPRALLHPRATDSQTPAGVFAQPPGTRAGPTQGSEWYQQGTCSPSHARHHARDPSLPTRAGSDHRRACKQAQHAVSPSLAATLSHRPAAQKPSPGRRAACPRARPWSTQSHSTCSSHAPGVTPKQHDRSPPKTQFLSWGHRTLESGKTRRPGQEALGLAQHPVAASGPRPVLTAGERAASVE